MNKGMIWKNEYKQPGSKQPDMTGKITVEGKEYSVAMWYYPEKQNMKEAWSIILNEPYRPAEDPLYTKNPTNIDKKFQEDAINEQLNDLEDDLPF